MEKIVNIKNLEELKQIAISCDDVCKIPLLHGTRRYALQTTEKERERFYSACNIVMDFAKKLATSDEIDEEKVLEYQRKYNPNFLNILVYTKGISKFTYSDFYVTSSYSSAISFSHNVGGELGNTAHAQCLGFRYFNIALDEAVSSASKTIIEEYQKYLESEKIIIAFYGVKFEDLLQEDGTDFLIAADTPQQEAYNIHIIKRLHKSIDTDSLTTNANFRLVNLDTYTKYVIGEKLFKSGFSIFTQISDVEKKIKNHNFVSPNKWEF